jgi:HPt (histidine-containing phosphotransfer) domain-containing protein
VAEHEPIHRAALDTLLETVGGDPEFLAELLDAYFDDSPAQLDAMRRAAAASNAEELRRAAHSLKSTSANFGALTLAALCQHLEVQANSGTPSDVAEWIARVDAEYERARSALQSLRAGDASNP